MTLTPYSSERHPIDTNLGDISSHPKTPSEPPSPQSSNRTLPFNGSIDTPTATAAPRTVFQDFEKNLQRSPPPQTTRRLSSKIDPKGGHVVAPQASAAPGVQRTAAAAQQIAHNANYGRAVDDVAPQVVPAQQARAGSPAARPAGGLQSPIPRSGPMQAVPSGALSGTPQTSIKIDQKQIAKNATRAVRIQQELLGKNPSKEKIEQFRDTAKEDIAKASLLKDEKSNALAKAQQDLKNNPSSKTCQLVVKQAMQDVKFSGLVIAIRSEQVCYAEWRLAVMEHTKANNELKNASHPDKAAKKAAQTAALEASKSEIAAEKAMKGAYTGYQTARKEFQTAATDLHKTSIETLKVYEDRCKTVQKQLKQPIDEKKLGESIIILADIAKKMTKLIEFSETMPDMINAKELQKQQSRVVNLLKTPIETLLAKARENRDKYNSPNNENNLNWLKANSLVRMADVANYSIEVERLKFEGSPDQTILDSTIAQLKEARRLNENANRQLEKLSAPASAPRDAGVAQSPSPLVGARSPSPQRLPQQTVIGPPIQTTAGQPIVQPKVSSNTPFRFRVGNPPEQRQLDMSASEATIKQYQDHASEQKKAAQASLPAIAAAQKKAAESLNNPLLGEHNKSTRQLEEKQAMQDVKFVNLVIANRFEQVCYADWLLTEKDHRKARENLQKLESTPRRDIKALKAAELQDEQALHLALKAEDILYQANTYYQTALKEWQTAATEVHTQSIATLRDYQSQCEDAQSQFKTEMPTNQQEVEACRASLSSFARIATGMMKLIDYNKKMPNTLNKTELEREQNQVVEQLETLRNQAETFLANARGHREALHTALKKNEANPSQAAQLKYNFAVTNLLVQNAKVAICLTEVAALKAQDRPDPARLKTAETNLQNAREAYVQVKRYENKAKEEYLQLEAPRRTAVTPSQADEVLGDLLTELGVRDTPESRPTANAKSGRKLSDAENQSLDASLASIGIKPADPMDMLDNLLAEVDAEKAAASTSPKLPLSTEENNKLQEDLKEASKKSADLKSQLDRLPSTDANRSTLIAEYKKAHMEEAQLVRIKLLNLKAKLDDMEKRISEYKEKDRPDSLINQYKELKTKANNVYVAERASFFMKFPGVKLE